jgi:hypothetical protein
MSVGFLRVHNPTVNSNHDLTVATNSAPATRPHKTWKERSFLHLQKRNLSSNSRENLPAVYADIFSSVEMKSEL